MNNTFFNSCILSSLYQEYSNNRMFRPSLVKYAEPIQAQDFLSWCQTTGFPEITYMEVSTLGPAMLGVRT